MERSGGKCEKLLIGKKQQEVRKASIWKRAAGSVESFYIGKKQREVWKASSWKGAAGSVKRLMLGNEAVARGAYEAGCTVSAAYPGTPSTEISQYYSAYDNVYCEWSPNEKVALEVAIGASIAGARAMCSMKHVGLNVAADPLFSVAYSGINGGLVIAVADDPGMDSSQNEQDTRFYGKSAHVPVLEPADSGECKEFVKEGFKLSEKFDTPVIVRLTTKISHSKTIVDCEQPEEYALKPYQKDIGKYVMMPMMARKRHAVVAERDEKLCAYAEKTGFNRIIWGEKKIGIVCSGVAFQYAREALGDTVSYLKLGMAHPIPKELIKEFAAKVDAVYVVEELEPFFENQIKAMGLKVIGKDILPICGAYHANMIAKAFQPILATTQGDMDAEAALGATKAHGDMDAVALDVAVALDAAHDIGVHADKAEMNPMYVTDERAVYVDKTKMDSRYAAHDVAVHADKTETNPKYAAHKVTVHTDKTKMDSKYAAHKVAVHTDKAKKDSKYVTAMGKAEAKHAAEPLPQRLPVMCPGCPHRGTFHVLKTMKLQVLGDIGCYSLGALAPMQAMDTCICMGASIGMAHGFEKARGLEESRKTIAVLGDATFAHSGITGLMDVVYNKGAATTLILDNLTTGMAGHQENPSTGYTLRKQPAKKLDLVMLAYAIGVSKERVRVVNPFDIETFEKVLWEELEAQEASVVIARRPCALLKDVKHAMPQRINQEKCTMCNACREIGCPAMVFAEHAVVIDDALCAGCKLCKQLCRLDAIGTI